MSYPCAAVSPIDISKSLRWKLTATLTGSAESSRKEHDWLIRFGPKIVRLAPDGTNPGLFQITFQYILAQRQNVLKSDLKKTRICPIRGQIWPIFGRNLITQNDQMTLRHLLSHWKACDIEENVYVNPALLILENWNYEKSNETTIYHGISLCNWFQKNYFSSFD